MWARSESLRFCQGVAYRGEVIEFVRLHARLRRVAEGAVRPRLAAHLHCAMAAQGLEPLVAPGLGGRPSLTCACRGATQDDGDIVCLAERVPHTVSARQASLLPVQSRRGHSENDAQRIDCGSR